MASPVAGQVPPETPQEAPPQAARRGATASRLAAGFLLVLLTCLSGAELGLWFVPFVLGVAAGVFARRSRGPVLVIAVLTVTGGAVAGWAVALWIMALSGLPVGATARTIAALAGLPPYAAVAIAVTLLLAALQALAGSWLARAVFPRQLRLPFPRRGPGQPVGQQGGTARQADPQP
jgi:hypothetical protein